MNIEIQSPPKSADIWDASNDDYHASPGISNSKLSDFIDDPQLYYHYHVAKDWQRPAATEEMKFGTAIHEMLPPGSIESLLTIIPREVLNSDGHRKGKAYAEFVAANQGATLIKAEDAEPYIGIIERARANPKAMWLLEAECVELNVRWKDEKRGLVMRARLDRLRPGEAIADIKTTRATNAREFAAEAFRNGYHRQAAFYRAATFQLTGDLLPFVFIACRKSRPYSVECYEISDDFLELGRQEVEDALDRLTACEITGRWEQDGHGTILLLDPPTWAKYQNQWEYREND